MNPQLLTVMFESGTFIEGYRDGLDHFEYNPPGQHVCLDREYERGYEAAQRMSERINGVR